MENRLSLGRSIEGDREMFFLVTPTSVGICWSDRAKSTRADPYRPDTHVLIEGHLTDVLWRHIITMVPGEPLSRLTTSEAA